MRQFFITTVLALLGLWSAPVAALSSADRAELPHVNLLKNPGFELGKASWSNSGGSFSHSVSGANGLVTFNPSASGQYFQSALVTIPADLATTGSCLAYIKHDNTDATEVLKVLDSSGNLLAQASLGGDIGSAYNATAVPFKCPSGQIRMRIESTADSPLVSYDSAWLGSDNASFIQSNAETLGTVRYAGTSLCEWTPGNTGGAYTAFSADTDCPTATVSGSKVSAPGTKIPAIVSTNLAPGWYKVTFSGQFVPENNSTTATQRCRISDGTSTSGYLHTQITSGVSISASRTQMTGYFYYALPQSSVTWQPQCASSSDSNDPYIINSNTLDSFEASLEFSPAQNQAGRRYDTYGWFVDASIATTNTTNISTGTGSQATYSGLENANLAMTQNSTSTLSVGIPCSSTNAATVGALTCSVGNESIGVTYNLPKPGKARACFVFGHRFSGGTTADASIAFQVVETAANSQTILQEGGDKLSVRSTVDNDTVSHPFRVCGIFDFVSAGQKTLRLFYEQSASNLSASEIFTDLETTIGQRNIRVTVEPISESVPAPVVSGPFEPVTAVSGSYTVLAGDRFIEADATGGALTVTLPTAVGATGKLYTISKKDSSANLVTIATTSSQTIGSKSATVTRLIFQGEAVTLRSDGANWRYVSDELRIMEGEITQTGNSTCTAGKGAGYSVSCSLAGVVDVSFSAPFATSAVSCVIGLTENTNDVSCRSTTPGASGMTTACVNAAGTGQNRSRSFMCRGYR